MSEARAIANSFFRSLETSKMSEPEAVLHRLKMEKEALLRRGSAYACELRSIEQYDIECRVGIEARHGGHDLHGRRYRDKINRQAAAYERVMTALNERFPSGYCRKELDAINAAIAKATVELRQRPALVRRADLSQTSRHVSNVPDSDISHAIRTSSRAGELAGADKRPRRIGALTRDTGLWRQRLRLGRTARRRWRKRATCAA
ncbi:hypothetical protein [Bradyrhizobium sp.]|uniref:hypothetical protein n=1 Tax=Bradyrhizobium sp. TaxID=376 RepID=UPI003BB0741E